MNSYGVHQTPLFGRDNFGNTEQDDEIECKVEVSYRENFKKELKPQNSMAAV